MKLVLSSYYNSIKNIEYVEEKFIQTIKPVYRPGDKMKFLGIPYRSISECLYEIPAHYMKDYYGFLFTYDEIVENFNKKQFSFDKLGENLELYSKPRVIIDDVSYYFDTEKEAKTFLSTVKGRCTECGNKIYKCLG